MKFISVRQTWHDSFMSESRANHLEWSSTALDTSSKLMDRCEKGIIQHTIAQLKERDALAHAWGMFAYTPAGWPSATERGYLLDHLLAEYNRWTGFERLEDKVHQDKIRMLARLAMHVTARRDRGQTGKTDMSLARKAVGCSEDLKLWNSEWKPVWRKLNRWLEPLPGRALGSISVVVVDYSQRLAA